MCDKTGMKSDWRATPNMFKIPMNSMLEAVSNALKVRMFPDDDQFSMGLALVSTESEELACNIFVIDASDAGEFFNIRSSGTLYW